MDFPIDGLHFYSETFDLTKSLAFRDSRSSGASTRPEESEWVWNQPRVSEIFQKKKKHTPKSALKLSRAQKTMEQVLLFHVSSRCRRRCRCCCCSRSPPIAFSLSLCFAQRHFQKKPFGCKNAFLFILMFQFSERLLRGRFLRTPFRDR